MLILPFFLKANVEPIWSRMKKQKQIRVLVLLVKFCLVLRARNMFKQATVLFLGYNGHYKDTVIKQHLGLMTSVPYWDEEHWPPVLILS